MHAKQIFPLLMLLLATTSSVADDPEPPSLSQAIDQLVQQGTPYVVLISNGGAGGYEILLITTTAAGLVTTETGYNELGQSEGVLYGGSGMLLADYIDYYNLSHDDSCSFDPYCYGSTSGSNGST